MSRIENKAVNKLREMIDKLDFIDEHFDAGEKNISIDGYYDVYKNKNFTKENFVGSIFVQIKGCEGSTFNRNNLTYPVYKEDLKIYQDRDGIIFFVVDLMESKIYYKEFLPYDIMVLLKDFSTKSKRVQFAEIKDEKVFEYISRTFLKNKEIQKSSILTDFVLENDMIPFTTAYVPKNGDELRNILDIEQYVYVKNNVQNTLMVDKTKFLSLHMEKEVVIDVDGKMFNKKILLTKTKNGDFVIIDNMAFFDLKNKRVEFVLKGSLNEQLDKLEFLIATSIATKIEIKNMIRFELNSHIPKEQAESLKSRKEYLNKVKKVLELIGFEKDVILNDVTKEEKALMDKLIIYFIDNKEILIYEKDTYGVLKYGNVPLFILFARRENENFNRLYILNKEYSKLKFAYVVDDDVYLEASIFSALDSSFMSKCNYFNWTELSDNIIKYVDTEEQRARVNLSILEFIKSYDKTNNIVFLECAEKMIDRLLSIDQNDLFQINKMQIKIRKSKLEDEEKNILIDIRARNIQNNQVMCAVEILLRNKSWNIYFNRMTKEEQDTFKNFPIYYLVKDLN